MNTNLERASAEEKTPSGRDQPDGVKTLYRVMRKVIFLLMLRKAQTIDLAQMKAVK